MHTIDRYHLYHFARFCVKKNLPQHGPKGKTHDLRPRTRN
jgi:hypothetical protein